MSKPRRFRVESLQGLRAGDVVTLPEAQARHLHVLRLTTGTEITVFDGAGRSALAMLAETPEGPRAVLILFGERTAAARNLTLASAWPKGKRAALLVEKCSELGVNIILPVRYERSVVHKAEGSESLARLRRIAAEAAKQCGRNDEPEIGAERSLGQVLAAEARHAFALLLDAHADARLADVLLRERAGLREQAVLLIVGPEGGLAPAELAAAAAAGVVSVRLARHVLRVETAALAACAIAGALLG
jgi:16S rRNA (uracil1498-N3)-methyltransferase